MIILLGDTHAEFQHLPKILENVPQDATIIQVGDFGFWPDCESDWNYYWKRCKREKPMYFIDGNHEYHPHLGHHTPVEVWKGLIHLPRGYLFEVDGKNIACFGGAESIDRIYRRLGKSYFLDEVPSQTEFQRLLDINVQVDMMVTHTAPQNIVRGWFPHPSKRFPEFELASDWKDPTCTMVEQAWRKFNYPPLFCGHFHQTVTAHPGPVRILDINEVVEWRYD